MSSSETNGAGTTLLIVDDEPELLEIFSVWMARERYRVLTAANGADALHILKEEKIDALISDIRMPIMDGLMLVRKIADLGLLIPSIIFVSGFGDVSLREMYALGVEAMLPKPLARKLLLEALESSLKERQELWLNPADELTDETLAATFPSLKEAKACCDFQVGRGGVCLRSDRTFVEDTLVHLAITFTEEGLELRGQAKVRWCAPKEHRIGAAFVYLDPASRDWVLAEMTGKARFSFIPSCAPPVT